MGSVQLSTVHVQHQGRPLFYQTFGLIRAFILKQPETLHNLSIIINDTFCSCYYYEEVSSPHLYVGCIQLQIYRLTH